MSHNLAIQGVSIPGCPQRGGMKTEGLARPQRDRLEGLGGLQGALGQGRCWHGGHDHFAPGSCQLHAEYCREKDAYLPHRLVQAWELAQFIR